MLTDNVARVLGRVNAACLAAGRRPGSVKIILATKTQPISAINDAINVILRQGAIAPQSAESLKPKLLIGENRVQELVAKADGLPDVELHFIGPLQKNKINQLLATQVSCVETIDSLELAQALSTRATRPIDVMVQVNVSGEPTKAGCMPDAATALAVAVNQLPNLRLTGFMTIGLRPIISEGLGLRDSATAALPLLAQNDEGGIVNSREIREGYRVLREIRDSVDPALELSMGMSTDLELAIAEGATIVRIGSAIFGSRN